MTAMPAIGIALGRGRSMVATHATNHDHVLRDRDGSATLKTVVHLASETVGEAAIAAAADPRDLCWPLGEDGLGADPEPATRALACLLAHHRDTATYRLGHEITEACLALPEAIIENAGDLVREAARRAGFEHVCLISRAHAAVYTYHRYTLHSDFYVVAVDEIATIGRGTSNGLFQQRIRPAIGRRAYRALLSAALREAWPVQDLDALAQFDAASRPLLDAVLEPSTPTHDVTIESRIETDEAAYDIATELDHDAFAHASETLGSRLADTLADLLDALDHPDPRWFLVGPAAPLIDVPPELEEGLMEVDREGVATGAARKAAAWQTDRAPPPPEELPVGIGLTLAHDTVIPLVRSETTLPTEAERTVSSAVLSRAAAPGSDDEIMLEVTAGQSVVTSANHLLARLPLTEALTTHPRIDPPVLLRIHCTIESDGTITIRVLATADDIPIATASLPGGACLADRTVAELLRAADANATTDQAHLRAIAPYLAGYRVAARLAHHADGVFDALSGSRRTRLAQTHRSLQRLLDTDPSTYSDALRERLATIATLLAEVDPRAARPTTVIALADPPHETQTDVIP